MNSRRWTCLAAVLALLGAAAWFLRPGARVAARAPRAMGALAGGARPLSRPTVIVPGNWPDRSPAEIAKATPPGVLHYADRLNTRGETAQDDVQLLVSLLQLYRNLSHLTNPVGDNAEITAVLTGKNKLGYAFVRPDHPAINSQGELCDRWGTPYFFHQLSGEKMEIRSAGPDHKLWTADDVVLTP